MEKRVLVITGPTATGKSALGIECAKRLGGEIISADSMQLYRGMDIGTAKVPEDGRQGVPHHLIDVASPDEDWSAARWVDAAAERAEDIFSRGLVPIIVGGTNLYIDSLLSGRDFAAREDETVRARLNAEYDALGGEAFRARLRAVDPERADILHPADRKRLVRAQEVWELTGETLTAHDARTKALPPRWASLRIALNWADRADLYARIDARVDEMIDDGLFDEVEMLLVRGLSPDCTAMQAIGYKEVAAYFGGRVTAGDAIDAIKQNSRRYAKRQLTWLRRDAGVHWIVWDGTPDIPAAADRVLSLWNAAP